MAMTVVTEEHANIVIVDAFPAEGDEAPAISLTARTTTFTADLTTWHRRLGHLNVHAVSLMTGRHMATWMEVMRGSTLQTPCEPCVKGKQGHQQNTSSLAGLLESLAQTSCHFDSLEST